MTKEKATSSRSASMQNTQPSEVEHEKQPTKIKPRNIKIQTNHKASKVFNIRHALIVRSELAIAVTKALRKYYKNVETRLHLSDGSSLSYKNDEWSNYQNYKNRQIDYIHITAKTGLSKTLSAEIEIFGDSQSLIDDFFDINVRIKILDLSDDSIKQLSAELREIFHEMKPGYSFLTKNLTPLLIKTLPILSAAYMVLMTMKGQLLQLVPGLPPLRLIFGVAIFMTSSHVLLSVLNRLKNWFFPPVFFLIGQGHERFKSKEKWRDMFLIGFVLSCILGGYLTNITSPYLAKWLHLTSNN